MSTQPTRWRSSCGGRTASSSSTWSTSPASRWSERAMPDLVVAGAGMAGLAAAAHARERGADVLLLEKGDRPGGSMLLSSGMVWRYRDFGLFREECPAGDPALQQLVFDRLDGDLAWLESLGAPVVERETGNPLTTGVRFDARGLTEALARDSGARLGEP